MDVAEVDVTVVVAIGRVDVAVGGLALVEQIRETSEYLVLPLRGDLNCDEAINFGDINPFVLRLGDPEEYRRQYPNCPDQNGDVNRDGAVDFGDINPFVELLARSL